MKIFYISYKQLNLSDRLLTSRQKLRLNMGRILDSIVSFANISMHNSSQMRK